MGDVITQIDGKEVTDAGGLQVVVGQQNPGTTIHLQVMRDGKSVTIPVTLEAMGSRDKSGNETSDAGHGKTPLGNWAVVTLLPMCASNCRPRTIFTERWSSKYSRAARRTTLDCSRGDVILEVDRKPVQNAAEVQKALGSVPTGQDALVLVWSNGGNTFRVLHATEAGQSDSGS